MATRNNLMAFGMNPLLAQRTGINPVNTSVSGATLASANRIGWDQYFTLITASATGSGLCLPPVGGEPSSGVMRGSLLGDQFRIANMLQAAIVVYASNSATFICAGTSASGDTGISIGTAQMAIFYPVTATTWIGIKSGSA